MSQAIEYVVVFNKRGSPVSLKVAGTMFYGVEACNMHNDFIHNHGARFVSQSVMAKRVVATYMV